MKMIDPINEQVKANARTRRETLVSVWQEKGPLLEKRAWGKTSICSMKRKTKAFLKQQAPK